MPTQVSSSDSVSPIWAAKAFAALSQINRLNIFRALVVAGPEGLFPSALADSLGMPSNTLSFHLKELLGSALISQTREGRHVLYRANFSQINALGIFLMDDCCKDSHVPSSTSLSRPLNPAQEITMNAPKKNVLFLCTGNSARSIMAEAILNQLGANRFQAFSAGSHPNGSVSPHAIALLEKNNFATENLRSKNWDEFAKADAPQMDFVLTVCDKAAGEVCPLWPGQPISAHWGVSDPVDVQGSDAEKAQAFVDAFLVLNRRISLLLSLPMESLDRLALQNEVKHIGQL